MKKTNKAAISLFIVFILILAFRFKTLEAIDRLFYLLAIVAFLIMGIAPIVNINKKK
jgi:hypothetical protein